MSDHCDNPNKVAAIVSYCGNLPDVGINYALLVVNFVAATSQFLGRQRSAEMSAGGVEQERHHGIFSMTLSLVVVILFQVLLCVGVGCVGISIVWCAIMGWMLTETWRWRQFQQEEGHENATGTTVVRVAVLMDIVAIGYYACSLPPISTVAHLLAIALGAALDMISLWCNRNNAGERRTADTTHHASEMKPFKSEK